MTNNTYFGIISSINNIEPDALITLHLHSGSYVSAYLNNISNCGDYLSIDTDEKDSAYVPIESIEFIQY